MAKINFQTAVLILFTAVLYSYSQTSSFTHQGRLNDGASPANGNYDFEFKFFDAASGGSQQGATAQRLNIAVANGIYAVSLDFGAPALPGADRYLDIAVRSAGGGAFTPLAPRQKITSAPYAVRSLSAAAADTVTGTIPVSSIPAGSGSYIQNSTAQQPSSNFNISGNGTVGGAFQANVVDVVAHYRINGGRVLAAGSTNLFVGQLAGESVAGGIGNAFIGNASGRQNTTGNENSYLGANSNQFNLTGSGNTMIGYFAGAGNGINYSTAIGHRARVAQSNSLVLGSIEADAGANATRFVGIGTITPFYRLHVVGENVRVEGNSASIFPRFSLNYTGGFIDSKKWQNYASGSGTFGNLIFSALNDGENAEQAWMTVTRQGLTISSVQFPTGDVFVANRITAGTVAVATLGAAGSTPLCRGSLNLISTCSSSLRYKTNIGQFSQGMTFVRQLRPITFDWKDGGMRDVGFGAEDIVKIDARFVTYNSAGEVEGVKYDRLSVAFVNAFKEHQTQLEFLNAKIDELMKENATLKSMLEQIKTSICKDNSSPLFCKERNK